MPWERHDELYKKMWFKYKNGFSCSEIAKMFGISRQAVHEGFKNRGLKLRQKNIAPYKFFKGKKFTLRNMGYYGLTTNERTLMHRFVWEFYNGKIPDSFDIHHRDKDKSNNKLENLELLSKSEHAKLYSTGHNQFTKQKSE